MAQASLHRGHRPQGAVEGSGSTPRVWLSAVVAGTWEGLRVWGVVKRQRPWVGVLG